MQDKINFEALASQTVNRTLQGSDTPFRDALSNAFSLLGNTIATGDAIVCGIRYHAEGFKQESANDFIMQSARLDTKANEQAMARTLRDIQLRKALEAEMATA